MHSTQSQRRNLSVRNRSGKQVICRAVESLEGRLFLSATGESVVSGGIPAVLAHPASAASDSVSLDRYFTNPTVPGTLVTFNTTFGQIQVALTDAATPLTVANFLSYVNSGAYTNTIFHRSAFIATTGTPSAATPADIIQGGGYAITNGSLNHIPVNAPVQDEYTTELFGNVAGTIAMAKTTSANSATSEFYFNENNNTSLDTPATDSNGVTTSYTVFGDVVSGLNVVKEIASLPAYNLGSSLPTLPVTGLTQAEVSKNTTLTANNLVFVNTVTSQAGTTFTATSDKPKLVTPTVTNGVLSFAYASAFSGTADITVKATNLDGTSASTTFAVTVPDTAQLTEGPTASAITIPAIVTGTPDVIHTLNSATDSVSALTTQGVAIVTQPTNGTATVDANTGYITYTTATGFTGTDTLTYTVTDAAGTTSSPATVTLTVVPLPKQVTIGTAGIKGLTFTQPDGTVGHLSVTGGSAVVTFADYQVTTSTAGGIITATGLGATLSEITITDFRGASASLSLASAGAITLGSVNDAGKFLNLNAPNATLTGNSSLASLNRLNVAALIGASVDVGSFYLPRFLIGTVQDSDIQASGTIALIQSRQWIIDDGGSHAINAVGIEQLKVSGAFAENLLLSGKGYDLFQSTTGTPSGSWQLSGSIFNARIASPASTWSINANGLVQRLNVTGDLVGTIQAAAIASLNVTGGATGAVIQTSAAYSKRVLQIGHIGIAGAVANTVIFSAGNIGSISVGSLTGSRIYAGVTQAAAQTGSLVTTTSDLTAGARIQSVIVGRGKLAFSNSQIDADILGSLRLGNIATDNSGTPEGVAAQFISSISATLTGSSGSTTALNLGPAQFVKTKTLTAAQVLAAFLVKKKITTSTTSGALGDFALDLY